MGHDVRYLPREVYDSSDDILGESVNSKFTRAYSMEMYLANVEGYEGDGDFFSKFGLEIRDTSNFVVSRKAFEKYVPSSLAARPREGDLLYVPVLGKIFEIKFVEEELMFFSLGKRAPYMYELRCEVFRSSNEDFNTGDDQIDDIENVATYTVEIALSAGSGNYHQNETVYQGANLAYATATAKVAEWRIFENKLNLVNIKGNFIAGANIIGSVSNTSYMVAGTDDMADVVPYDDSDNRIIQTEANTFIDLSEINPFGMP